MKAHIHTKSQEGPILLGNYQDAQDFVHELTTDFGINPRHCKIIDKKIYIDVEGQKVEAHYVKLGERQGSCFYLPIPENSATLQTFLEENLVNIRDIKFVEDPAHKTRFAREVPAHI